MKPLMKCIPLPHLPLLLLLLIARFPLEPLQPVWPMTLRSLDDLLACLTFAGIFFSLNNHPIKVAAGTITTSLTLAAGEAAKASLLGAALIVTPLLHPFGETALKDPRYVLYYCIYSLIRFLCSSFQKNEAKLLINFFFFRMQCSHFAMLVEFGSRKKREGHLLQPPPMGALVQLAE